MILFKEVGDIGYTFSDISDTGLHQLCIIDARFWVSNVNLSLLEIPETVLVNNVEYNVVEVSSAALDRVKGFYKEIRFPNSIVKLPNYCLYGCKDLEKIVFGYGITEIPSFFAMHSFNLKEVIFGDNIEIIGPSAFNDTGIEKLILPPKLREIGIEAFNCCNYLRKVIFPESVEYIGPLSFKGCSSLLGNIHFQGPPPKSSLRNSGIKYDIFPHHKKREYNTIFVKSKYIRDFLVNPSYEGREILLEEQKNLELEFKLDKVLLIPKLDKSGRNCYLGDIVVPKMIIYDGKLKNIDEIEDFAFSSCPELKSVILPAGIKLGNNVFFNSPQCKVVYEN